MHHPPCADIGLILVSAVISVSYQRSMVSMVSGERYCVSERLTRGFRGGADEDVSSSPSSMNSLECLEAANGVVGLKGISLVSSTAADACRDVVRRSQSEAWGSGWLTVETVN